MGAFALELTRTREPENVNVLHSLSIRTMLVHKKSKPSSTLSCWTRSIRVELQSYSIWVAELFQGGEWGWDPITAWETAGQNMGTESRLGPTRRVLSSAG